MTAIAQNSSGQRTLLLVLADAKRLIPISTAALSQAQNTRSALQTEYRNALLMDEQGDVRRIELIEILGPWGNTWSRRILSWLTNGWKIRTQLSAPVQIEFSELKSLLIDCIRANGLDRGDDVTQDDEQLIAALSRAQNSAQLFSSLSLPPSDQVLDVL